MAQAAGQIDIAIVNYRGAADTLQALQRLAAWPHGHLWLVDNSAHEPDMAAETALLQQQASVNKSGLTLLTPGANLGFGRACNLAFERSQAEFFLLLNPDARISSADVWQLADALVRQPTLGAVSPKIYWNEARSFVLPAPFPQTPQHSVALALATRSRHATRWAAQWDLQRGMRQMAAPQAFAVDFLAGAVLLLRRAAVWAAGGLFDPDYFMFFEDSDLSLRLRRAGYTLALLPAASAAHEYRHKAFKGDLMARSQQQFFSKQYPLFHRWSAHLARVEALAKPLVLTDWFHVVAQPVTSAAEFAAQTQHAPVLAFSPSVRMMPAIFRASVQAARCFDAEEWALLEPAAYVALLLKPDAKPQRAWVYFVKV